MYPLVAANNWGAAAFMLAWLVVGYFVILTLFMAIIMEAFESKYSAEESEEAFTACESCGTCHSLAFGTQGQPSPAMRCMVPATKPAQNWARSPARSVWKPHLQAQLPQPRPVCTLYTKATTASESAGRRQTCCLLADCNAAPVCTADKGNQGWRLSGIPCH